MDFEGHFGTKPSVIRRRVESELESDVSDSLHSVDESDSDSGTKKKKKRLPEFNTATDMENPDFKFILEARDKPVITLLEIIRTEIMQRIAKKKVEADKWTTTLCPKIQQKKEADESDDHSGKVGKKGIKMICTKCGKVGHNVRTCKGLVGGNSRLNRRQAQTQPSRDGTLPKLPVKRPFGGIRNEAAARDNFPNQHPESNQRASTQPPTINVVRWYMNTGGSSLSQPSPTIAASSAFSRNDQ
ncbi:hypothetical protein V6N13_033531 [Hibiscus sabdariffa]